MVVFPPFHTPDIKCAFLCRYGLCQILLFFPVEVFATAFASLSIGAAQRYSGRRAADVIYITHTHGRIYLYYEEKHGENKLIMTSLAAVSGPDPAKAYIDAFRVQCRGNGWVGASGGIPKAGP